MNMEAKLFNNAMDAILIKFVRVHPVLYQRKDPHYKDNAFKDKVWEEISTSLRRTVTECKTRWRTIRDSYKKTKNKMENKSSMYAFGSYPRSKYTSGCLSFLDDSFKDRASYRYGKNGLDLKLSTRRKKSKGQNLAVWRKRISASKCMDRIAQLNGGPSGLIFEDSSSQDPSKRGESTSEIPCPQVKLEIIENDEADNQEAERGDEASGYIIPDPLPQVKLEPAPVNHLLVPQIQFGIDRAYMNDRFTDIGDRNRDGMRLEPSCDVVTDPEPRTGKKRTPNQDCRSASEGTKRRRETVPEHEINSLSAAKCGDSVNEHPVDAFFRSMATTVKTFSPRLIAETRLEICRIVTGMELRFLSEQNGSFAPRIVSSGSAPSGNQFDQ